MNHFFPGLSGSALLTLLKIDSALGKREKDLLWFNLPAVWVNLSTLGFGIRKLTGL